MSENNHYVYVYLDPRKSGKYEYFENGVGISFDFEPFYVGEGKKERINYHLKEAKKEHSKDPNSYKLNKIRKIIYLKHIPIIYKICDNMSEQNALNLERTLGFLIGRKDQKLGPLTNLVDLGQKTTKLSKDSEFKKQEKKKLTYKNNPDIQKNQAINIKNTFDKDPSNRINAGKKISQTKNNKSSEEKQEIVCKFKKKLKDNPEIKINSTEKLKITFKNDPSIRINAGIRSKQTKQAHPEICINAGIKISKTKIEKKSAVGRSNSKYKKYDYNFLIKEYFNICNRLQIIQNYNITHKDYKLNLTKLEQFLKIMNFPINNLIYQYLKIPYLNFVEENKHKIQWYIDNYERLEDEYFLKKHYEKYKEF